MIEIRAKVDEERMGTHLDVNLEGGGEDIVIEAVSAIQGLMESIKEESFALHLLIIKTIADNPKILFGSDADYDTVSMHGVKIREGVN